MGQKLSPYQKELYQRVDEVLYYNWDPISAGCPRDEYQSYVPSTFSLLIKENGTPEELAAYLTNITVDRMGLTPVLEHDLKIASLLFEVMDELKNKHHIK